MPRKSKSPKKSIETLAREILDKKSKPRKVISSLPPGKGSPLSPKKAKRVKSSSPKKAKPVKSSSPKKTKRVKSSSPRRLSGYLLFSQEKRAELGEETKKELGPKGVISIIATLWKNASQDEREQYIGRAKDQFIQVKSPKKSIETLAREILDKKSKPRKVISSLPPGKGSPLSPKKAKRVKSSSPKKAKPVKSSSPKKTKRVKSSSPRRLSGYLLFSQEKRAELGEERKKELGPKGVISMIARQWKNASQDEREQYISKAKDQFIQVKSPKKAKRVQEKLPLPQGFEDKEAVILKKRGRPKKQKSQLDILD